MFKVYLNNDLEFASRLRYLLAYDVENVGDDWDLLITIHLDDVDMAYNTAKLLCDPGDKLEMTNRVRRSYEF